MMDGALSTPIDRKCEGHDTYIAPHIRLYTLFLVFRHGIFLRTSMSPVAMIEKHTKRSERHFTTVTNTRDLGESIYREGLRAR